MPRRNKRQQPPATKMSTNADTYKARAAAEQERQDLLADLMEERYGVRPDPEHDDKAD